jgi:Protein of unknown function (DUF3024)
MALSELEHKRWERELSLFLERRRPPVHIRSELDLGYRIEGQSVEIFEIRPDWEDKTTRRERPAAKATFIRSKNHWRIFWVRRDLKWHGYETPQEVRTLAEVLAIVDRDEVGCFFG